MMELDAFFINQFNWVQLLINVLFDLAIFFLGVYSHRFIERWRDSKDLKRLEEIINDEISIELVNIKKYTVEINIFIGELKHPSFILGKFPQLPVHEPFTITFNLDTQRLFMVQNANSKLIGKYRSMTRIRSIYSDIKKDHVRLQTNLSGCIAKWNTQVKQINEHADFFRSYATDKVNDRVELRFLEIIDGYNNKLKTENKRVGELTLKDQEDSFVDGLHDIAFDRNINLSHKLIPDIRSIVNEMYSTLEEADNFIKRFSENLASHRGELEKACKDLE